MKKEINILELFPKDFYVNKKGKFMSEMSMYDLNIIIDYIYNLKSKINEYETNVNTAIKYIEWQRRNPQYDNMWRERECESLINILKGN